jgi:hypothetical protein
MQGIVAFGAAGQYEGINGVNYRCRLNYQRFTLNNQIAAWVASDLALNVSGPIVWPQDRNLKMYEDTTNDWAARIDAQDALGVPGSDEYLPLKIYSALDHNQASIAISWFMYCRYGGELSYLLALKGKPKMLIRWTRQHILKFGRIGGALGYYGTFAQTSAYKWRQSGVPIPYADEDGFVDYQIDNTVFSTLNFNEVSSSQRAYLFRMYAGLKYFAKDAIARGAMQASDVPGLDAAIAAFEAQLAATTSGSWSSLAWKDSAIDFTSAGIL